MCTVPNPNPQPASAMFSMANATSNIAQSPRIVLGSPSRKPDFFNSAQATIKTGAEVIAYLPPLFGLKVSANSDLAVASLTMMNRQHCEFFQDGAHRPAS